MLRCCVWGEGRKRVGELESSEKVVYLQVESKNADESIMRAKSGKALHRYTATPLHKADTDMRRGKHRK